MSPPLANWRAENWRAVVTQNIGLLTAKGSLCERSKQSEACLNLHNKSLDIYSNLLCPLFGKYVLGIVIFT